MQGDAETANGEVEAIARGVCDAAEGEIANALYGDAGGDADYSAKDEGGEIEENDCGEERGKTEGPHFGRPLLRRGLLPPVQVNGAIRNGVQHTMAIELRCSFSSLQSVLAESVSASLFL